MEPVTRRWLQGVLLVFVAAHLFTAVKEREGSCYYATLSFWTLLLTAAVVALPLGGALGAAALAANAVVCGLYYEVVNRDAVTGRQVVVHGGAASVLVALAAGGAVACGAPALSAALAALLFFVLNACVQLWEERRTGGRPVYPKSPFKHPAWRLALVPAVGAALAAGIASA